MPKMGTTPLIQPKIGTRIQGQGQCGDYCTFFAKKKVHFQYLHSPKESTFLSVGRKNRHFDRLKEVVRELNPRDVAPRLRSYQEAV